MTRTACLVALVGVALTLAACGRPSLTADVSVKPGTGVVLDGATIRTGGLGVRVRP